MRADARLMFAAGVELTAAGYFTYSRAAAPPFDGDPCGSAMRWPAAIHPWKGHAERGRPFM